MRTALLVMVERAQRDAAGLSKSASRRFISRGVQALLAGERSIRAPCALTRSLPLPLLHLISVRQIARRAVPDLPRVHRVLPQHIAAWSNSRSR